MVVSWISVLLWAIITSSLLETTSSMATCSLIIAPMVVPGGNLISLIRLPTTLDVFLSP